MKVLHFLILTLLLTGMVCSHERAQDEMDLSGSWLFRLDPEDVGISEHWYAETGGSPIQLPGCLQAQGYGHDVSIETQWTGAIIDRSWYTQAKYAPYRQTGNIKLPFWLTPDKHYIGAAWYQKEIDIPEGWENRPVELLLERCHWQSRVWVNDTEIGSNISLSVPHHYDLTGVLNPGKNRLTIRIDNRLQTEIGENAHSVSDHTQTNWNGIVGKIRLACGNPLSLSDIRIYPDVGSKKFVSKIEVSNRTKEPLSAQLHLQCVFRGANDGEAFPGLVKRMTVGQEGERVELEFDLGDRMRTWDEFDPGLYELRIRIESESGSKLYDEKTMTFGMRNVSAKGSQILVNGRPVFLRGTLECCIFPETGYPPADIGAWKRIISICKAHGLNHIRFHSWCPPEAAFIAADELGFYYQVECAAWAKIGDGDSIDQWIYDEGDRILQAYGNHPSFILMAYGNEPGGENQKTYLGQLVDYWKEKDARRLYTGGAGWPMIPESDYHNTPDPRIQGWGAGLSSRINSAPPETMTDYRDYISKQDKPVISHEIGQWCVYPNFREIPKYTGHLKARNFEIFRDDLERTHMLDQAEDFLKASGKLQTLCYKEEIESALRTPGMGGFQLLDLHDFPGQGTALVGVLDAFWDEKGYVTAGEFHRFACETVPLARMHRRVWTTKDTFTAQIGIAHYGPENYTGMAVEWQVRNDRNAILWKGTLKPADIITGELYELETVSIPLKTIEAPVRLNLEVAIPGTEYVNDWDFWVFPVPADPAAGKVLIVNELDEEAEEVLNRGGSVLFLPDPETIRGDEYGLIPAGFSSIFWNTAWTARQAPHTLGILCNPDHPALNAFPTEFYSNWQWWDLVTKAHPFIIDSLPVEVLPVVQVVDDWFTNRRLALVFEAKVGRGKLLACAVGLQKDILSRPVAAQFKHSLLKYMNSVRFKPSVTLTAGQIQNLVTPPLTNKASGKTIILGHAYSPRYSAGGESALIDGITGSGSFGDGRWQGFEGDDMLATIDLGESTPVESISVRFLQSQGMWIFWPERVRILVSEDGRDFIELIDENWGAPVPDSRPMQRTARAAWKGMARYVRVEARNTAFCPSWHPGAGGKAWIFTDEIVVQ